MAMKEQNLNRIDKKLGMGKEKGQKWWAVVDLNH